jgi:hypothetical protein
MHPYICEQLAQQAAWLQPLKKKEPYTLDMVRALAALLKSTTDLTAIFLMMENAVYDWT